MTTRDSRRHRRQGNLTILLGTVLAVTALISSLGLLIPPPQSLPSPIQRPRAATCEHPQPVAVPVPVTSSVLLACPSVFDGRLVTVVGEAIGDLLRGPAGRRWVQVNDDAYADVGPLRAHRLLLGTNSGIAVLLPPDIAPLVLGAPGASGDLIEVVGTFSAAAPEDQGGPAVIARSTTIRRPGVQVDAPASKRLRIVTPVAVVISMGLLAAAWRRRTP